MPRLQDFKPTMHSDICVEDKPVYDQYNKLVKNNKFGAAQQLLDSNEDISACNAALLNSWENKIVQLDEWYKANDFYDPILYSNTEPSDDDMSSGGFNIWEQEY